MWKVVFKRLENKSCKSDHFYESYMDSSEKFFYFENWQITMFLFCTTSSYLSRLFLHSAIYFFLLSFYQLICYYVSIHS